VKFYSQAGVDRFLWENFFRGKRGGVFVDVGPNHGEHLSNTLFFERWMGWTGLCIEPRSFVFWKPAAQRKAIRERVLVAGSDIATLLEKHELFDIDCCSLDVPGTEFPILSGLDLERFRVKVVSVKSNANLPRLQDLMASKDYQFCGQFEQTYVFRRSDVRPLPITSVICAVWHRDPERHTRLGAHLENLKRQSVPVEPIYVFDGGDPVPEWLEARAISVNRPLTIYQAWNAALSLVETPLVMNLNLDDRLAPDAVQFLETELRRNGAIAAGGDWKVCFSQEQTDAVTPCYPAQDLPVLGGWPPKPGLVRRIGNSTGAGMILGPATIWRLDTHIFATPRIPWRLAEGTPLKVCGDLAWWIQLANVPDKKVLKVPMIIGNYYSHPEDQAEFRVPDERALLFKVGTSPL
jgi:hypothetical protein